MNKRYWMAVKFTGVNTGGITGIPNKVTGRYSIACELSIFNTKKGRDAWVRCVQCYQQAEAVDKKRLWDLWAGDSVEERERELESVIYDHEEC